MKNSVKSCFLSAIKLSAILESGKHSYNVTCCKVTTKARHKLPATICSKWNHVEQRFSRLRLTLGTEVKTTPHQFFSLHHTTAAIFSLHYLFLRCNWHLCLWFITIPVLCAAVEVMIAAKVASLKISLLLCGFSRGKFLLNLFNSVNRLNTQLNTNDAAYPHTANNPVNSISIRRNSFYSYQILRNKSGKASYVIFAPWRIFLFPS